MEGVSVREWVRNYLVYHHPSGVIICTRCDTPDCFRSLAGLRTHLREKHGYNGIVGATIANEILIKSGFVKDVSSDLSSLSRSFVIPPPQLPKCFAGLLITHCQKLYWNAPESLNEKNQSLPAVPHLPIVTGFQCAIDGCFQSFQSKDSLRAHYHKQHKSSSSDFLLLPTPESVKLQSLGNHGSKRKYFPIHELNSTTTTTIPLSSSRQFSSRRLGTLNREVVQESHSLRLNGEKTVSLDGTVENADSKPQQVSHGSDNHEDERNKSFSHSANRTCENKTLGLLENHGIPQGSMNNDRSKADSFCIMERSLPSLESSAPKEKKQVTFDLSKNSLAGDATNNCMVAREIVDRENSLTPTGMKDDAGSDRMKHVGSQVWNMIKNLNPGFKGHCTRKLSTGKGSHSDMISASATNGDDQLLDFGKERDKQGDDLFEVLCNFQELLGFLGYESLRDVPVELVRVPRYEALRASLGEMSEKSISCGDGAVSLERNHSKCGTFYDEDDIDDIDDNDDDDEDEISEEGKHSFSNRTKLDCQGKGKDKRQDNIRNGEDVQVGSMLLRELGFSESVVTAQAFLYLKHCRFLTHQCSESARRLVHTRERSPMGGEKRSSHDPRDRFRPVMKDSTLRDYAEEVSRLVLFCLRLSVTKLVYSSSAFAELKNKNKNEAETQESLLTNDRNIQTLDALRMKYKPNLLSRSKIESKYGKLMSLMPNSVVFNSWSFILSSISFKQVHDEESSHDKTVYDAFSKSLQSLQSVLCSVLLQTVPDPASTNRVLSRHFSAIFSVSHARLHYSRASTGTGRPISPSKRDEGSMRDSELESTDTSVHAEQSMPSISNNRTNSNNSQRDGEGDDDEEDECNETMKEDISESLSLESFKLKQAWQMSTMFSALLYASSCCGLWELFYNENENMSYGMGLDAVHDAFCFDKNNSVALLREFLSKAMHVLKKSDGGLNFLKCSRPGPEHAMCAWVDTVECSIPRLRKAVLSWQKRLRDIIHRDLLFGIKLPAGFWEDVASLQDHFRMVNRGFNVFSRSSHERFAMRCGRLIAEGIASDNNLFYRFFEIKESTVEENDEEEREGDGEDHHQERQKGKKKDSSSSGKSSSIGALKSMGKLEIRRDSTAAKEYLDHCREALNLALTLLHVTGGAPARETELESFLLENTAKSMRSFFVYHGQVVLRPVHSKTRSMSASNRNIARFLDVETSRLWVLLIAVVRPFEEALVKAKHGAEAAQIQARFMFASKGKKLSASQIRLTIKKEFQVEGIFFTFAQFRHWQCGIIRLVTESGEKKVILLQGWGPHRTHDCCLTNTTAGDADLNVTGESRLENSSWPCPLNAMDEQAGHTPGTADRIYAQGSHSFKGTPASKMVAFQQASRNWHKLLGLDSDWTIPGSSSHFVKDPGMMLSVETLTSLAGDQKAPRPHPGQVLRSFGNRSRSHVLKRGGGGAGEGREGEEEATSKRKHQDLVEEGVDDDGTDDVHEVLDNTLKAAKKKRRRSVTISGVLDSRNGVSESDAEIEISNAPCQPHRQKQRQQKNLFKIQNSTRLETVATPKHFFPPTADHGSDVGVAVYNNSKNDENDDEELKSLMLSPVDRATRKLRAMDYAISSLDQTSMSRTIGLSGLPLQPLIPVVCRKQILQGLRSVLERPDAVFTCPVQEEAIYNVLKRDRDMIVVMGTSMGKSAIFQTAPYLEGIVALAENRRSPVIIVVVPLVSLVSDHLREGSSIPGLNCGGWEDRNNSEIQLLFISVEHACGKEFARLLVKLVNERRLGCIFLDEGQYALLWLHFRPTFKRLGQSLHHPSIRIQRIVLSATIPPEQVDQVAQVYGLVRGYTVLRQPSTIRKNLSYHVRRFEQASFQSMNQSIEIAIEKAVGEELQHTADHVATNPLAYHRGNCFRVVFRTETNQQGQNAAGKRAVDVDEDDRDHVMTDLHEHVSIDGEALASFTVTKQQVMIYAPFQYLLEDLSKTLSKRYLHSFKERVVSPLGDEELDACVFVSDVMNYYGSLQARQKERNQARWMNSAKDAYHSLSKSARDEIKQFASKQMQQRLARRGEDLPHRSHRHCSGSMGSTKEKTEAVKRPLSIVIVQIMVATCAFGAGINSKPVRAIIHVGSSRSMVEYVQESGRAGRDGLPARCVVLYNGTFVENVAKSLTEQVPDIVNELCRTDASMVNKMDPIDKLQSEKNYDAQLQLSFAQHVLWLESCEQCRRTRLSAFLDVIPTAACIHDKETGQTSACDFCLDLQSHCHSGGGAGVGDHGGSSGRKDSLVASAEKTNEKKGVFRQLQQIKLPLRDSQIVINGNNTSSTHQAPPATIQHQKQEEKHGVDEAALGILKIMRDAREHHNESSTERIEEKEHEKDYARNKIALESFKEVMDAMFLDKCVFCLAIKGVTHAVGSEGDGNQCIRKNRACFRCFRKFCSTSSCKIFPSAEITPSKAKQDDTSSSRKAKPCKACGLLYFHGDYIHTWKRYGPTCPFRSAMQVCLGAWYLPATRKILIKKYSFSSDWDTKSDMHARLFVRWLREMDDRDELYNFMHVFSFITKDSD